MGTRESLYKLLRIAIGNESDLSLPADVSLAELMDLSEMAGINGLIVCGIQKLVDNGLELISGNEDEIEHRVTWIGRSMMIGKKTQIQWETIQKLVALFASKGIVTVGLKGVSVGQLYPNPMHRRSCDFDCYLLKKNEDGSFGLAYEEGNKVIESRGIAVDRRIYVHSIFRFERLTVENHHYLAAVKLSKRHRKMDEFLRSLLVSEPLQPVMGSQLMTGSTMFNAVFLTHHAHRHMLNEYLPIQLLADWALFIKGNATLDWQRFWEYADEFGMLRFAQSMTRLACKLLGATVPFELPQDEEADTLLEAEMWELPEVSHGQKSLFARRLSIISNLIHARKKYKVFYDRSSFWMIVAYVKGYFFRED